MRVEVKGLCDEHGRDAGISHVKLFIEDQRDPDIKILTAAEAMGLVKQLTATLAQRSDKDKAAALKAARRGVA